MTTKQPIDGVFATQRRFPYPRAQVFAALARAEQLARWWGPAGFTNTFEVFEFRPQGRWKFTMHGPDGKDYANDNVFLETSPERVVIRHACQPFFTLTITLTEENDQTELDWRQALDDPRVAENIAHIVIPANEQNLDRLQAVLSGAAE